MGRQRYLENVIDEKCNRCQEKIVLDREQESTRHIFAQIFCNYYTFAHPCTLHHCNKFGGLSFVVSTICQLDVDQVE